MADAAAVRRGSVGRQAAQSEGQREAEAAVRVVEVRADDLLDPRQPVLERVVVEVQLASRARRCASPGTSRASPRGPSALGVVGLERPEHRPHRTPPARRPARPPGAGRARGRRRPSTPGPDRPSGRSPAPAAPRRTTRPGPADRPRHARPRSARRRREAGGRPRPAPPPPLADRPPVDRGDQRPDLATPLPDDRRRAEARSGRVDAARPERCLVRPARVHAGPRGWPPHRPGQQDDPPARRQVPVEGRPAPSARCDRDVTRDELLEADRLEAAVGLGDRPRLDLAQGGDRGGVLDRLEPIVRQRLVRPIGRRGSAAVAVAGPTWMRLGDAGRSTGPAGGACLRPSRPASPWTTSLGVDDRDRPADRILPAPRRSGAAAAGPGRLP